MAGRKKTLPAVQQGPEFVGKTPADLAEAEVIAREAGALPSHDQLADMMGAVLMAGQARGALMMETVSSKIIAESYVAIVKSNGYIGIPYKKNGEPGNISSLDEFCEVFFGKTARRCRQLAENLNTLGADLFERADLIGFRQRDFNALKALPVDDQAAIKQALEEGEDRDTIVEKLVSLTERQIREKEELGVKLQKKGAEYESLSQNLADTSEKLAEAKAKAALLPKLKPAEKIAEMQRELEGEFIELRAQIRQTTAGIQKLIALADETSDENDEAAVCEVEQRVVETLQPIIALVADFRLRGLDAPANHILAALSEV